MPEETSTSSSTLKGYLKLFGAFILGAVVSPILGEIAKRGLNTFEVWRSGPRIEVCAPLQQAKLIVRKNNEIVADEDMRFPNETVIVLESGGNDLSNVKLMARPLSMTGAEPTLLLSKVTSSDNLGADLIDVSFEQSTTQIDIELLRSNETVFIDGLFDQPISYIVEMSWDGGSLEVHGMPGCSNVSQDFQTSPVVDVYNYISPECSGIEGSCEIEAVNVPFSVDEDGVVPTVEEVIYMFGERVVRQ